MDTDFNIMAHTLHGRADQTVAFAYLLFTVDVKMERVKCQEAEQGFQARRAELQQQLEAVKLSHAEALLQQREQHEQQNRALQVRHARLLEHRRMPGYNSSSVPLMLVISHSRWFCKLLLIELLYSPAYCNSMYIMQRAVAEAEEELERQRRELSAGFLLQSQQLEHKYRQQAEAAAQEAAIAKELAAQTEQEAKAAHAREMEQLKKAEVSHVIACLAL